MSFNIPSGDGDQNQSAAGSTPSQSIKVNIVGLVIGLALALAPLFIWLLPVWVGGNEQPAEGIYYGSMIALIVGASIAVKSLFVKRRD